ERGCEEERPAPAHSGPLLKDYAHGRVDVRVLNRDRLPQRILLISKCPPPNARHSEYTARSPLGLLVLAPDAGRVNNPGRGPPARARPAPTTPCARGGGRRCAPPR